MLYRAISSLIVVLGISACGGSKVTVEADLKEQDSQQQGIQTELSPGEMLAVVSVSPSTGDDLVECLELALIKEGLESSLVSSRKLRDSMFPWFEPGIAPHGAEKLQRLMELPLVDERIDRLGLRYLVTLSGETSSSSDSWGGCAGGGMGAACVGGMSTRKATDLTAKVLDVDSLEDIAEIKASGSGKSEVGMIVIIPYFVASATESDTCAALAERIVALLNSS